MSKEIKGFITRDDFISSSNTVTSPIYELSSIGLTYSKTKERHFSTANPLYTLYVFNSIGISALTQAEVNSIIDVVSKFSEFLTTSTSTNKPQLIVSFLNLYNPNNPSNTVAALSYNTIQSYAGIRSVDYITFNIKGISVNIWLSDSVFRTFYPGYSIHVTLPFSDFTSVVNNISHFITALDNFNPVDFNKRIEQDKDNIPPTHTRLLNIPFRIPNTSIDRECLFAFNIYGTQGNYEYTLKLELYNYLTNVLGISAQHIQLIFPSILNINEFFIVPRWDKVAIPTLVGQQGISSQIAPTYIETFDTNKFIRVYDDNLYLKRNTYSVPFDYNNLLLQVTNGFHTEEIIKDFKLYYSDFITVTSTHPDFSRMSQRTQRFITLLENIVSVSNSDNSTELFNKILRNRDFQFTIINRGGINYLSYFFEQHQYYVIPRYEFQIALNA